MRSDLFKRTVRPRRGLTLTDLCVALALLVIVGAGVFPQVKRLMNEKRNRAQCGNNLRQIARAGIIYSNTSRIFPRLYWDPTVSTPNLYTGGNSPYRFEMPGDPRPNVPRPNDVTGAIYLLMVNEQLASGALLCPSDEDATPVYEGQNLDAFNNFASRANLSYSYNTPYPTRSATDEGWTFREESGSEVPLAADMNYGDHAAGGPTKIGFNGPAEAIRSANSANHFFDGQNVVYCDGHVAWESTPFCGVRKPGDAWNDNIYANQEAVDRSNGQGGKTLGLPRNKYDAVLLPTYFDGPQPATPIRTPANVGGLAALFRVVPWPFAAVGGVMAVSAVVLAVWMWYRKKSQLQPMAEMSPSGRRHAEGYPPGPQYGYVPPSLPPGRTSRQPPPLPPPLPPRK